MKKLCIALLILPSIIICISCDFLEGHEVIYSDLLTLKNNSDRDIVVRISLNYPDTILPRDCIYESKIFHPQETSIIRYVKDNDYFKVNPILQLFVYDYKTMVYSHFDSLRLQSMELKRYELSRERLEKCNSYITYP